MKKFLLLSLLFSEILFAQITKITPGTYISDIKNQNITLKINPDQTFGLEFMIGKIETQKDTLIFKNNNPKNGKFSLKPLENNSNTGLVFLQFNDKNFSYYTANIYIGTQKNQYSPVEYKRLSDYSKINEETYTYPDSIRVELPKTENLYLVDAGYDGATVCKFSLDRSLNNYEINYEAYSSSLSELKGYLDPKTNQLVLSDGKYPLLFSFVNENEAPKKTSYISAISETKDTDWLKKNGFSNELDAYATDSNSSGSYKFKYNIQKSFDSALKETAKTAKKYLVVCYDPKNKNNQKDFDQFVKENEAQVSDYMYSGYQADYDKFNFYLASSSDKKLLSQNNINSDTELLFYNADGNLVYHTKGTISDKKELFSPYNYITTDLDKSSKMANIDAVLNSKKASNDDIKKVLKKVLLLETYYDPNAYNDTTVQVVEDVNYKNVPPPPIISTKSVEAIKEVPADSTAIAVTEVSDDYYNLIKDKENLYQLKSTKELANQKWKQLIDFYSSKNKFDEDFVSIAKDELENVGFNNKLYKDTNKLASSNDFLVLDYIYKVYPEIIKNEQNLHTEKPADYDYSDYHYQNGIATVLSNFFSRNTSQYDNPDKIQLEKIMTYYKKYLVIAGQPFYAYQDYLNALKNLKDVKEFNIEYVSEFEKMFNSIHKTNSIIEDLDDNYSSTQKNNYGSWESFKNSFANLSNDVSWHIVETSKDAGLVKKAINWSETSIKIEKENHFYLDTLAQLYYKDNQKAKAIETETKAIVLAKDSENEQEYKDVLEKMKNGTY